MKLLWCYYGGLFISNTYPHNSFSLLETFRLGLVTASISSIPCVLLSIPLYSPFDTFINSVTVFFGCFILGNFIVLISAFRSPNIKLPMRLSVLCSISGISGLILLSILEIQIERSISFGFPILITNLLILRLVTVRISHSLLIHRWIWTFTMIFLSLLLSFAVIGFSDGPSGKLELPPATD